MLPYIAIRLFFWLPLLTIGVIFVTFFLTLHGSGDPIVIALGVKASPEVVERLRHALGLDLPWYIQFPNYLWNVLHFDFGESFGNLGIPVSDLIKPRMWVSFQLSAVTLVISLLLGVPLGLKVGTWQGSWRDRFLVGIVLLGIALPSFVVAPFFQRMFSVWFHVLPSSGWDGLFSLKILLPVLIMGVLPIAGLVRILRLYVAETQHAHYVYAARARGLPGRVVMRKYVIRNALMPLTTMFVFILIGLFSGALIIELIFGIPGLAKLALKAIGARDFPVIGAFTIIGMVIFISAMVLKDILYVLIDPRVRFSAVKRVEKTESFLSFFADVFLHPGFLLRPLAFLFSISGIVLLFAWQPKWALISTMGVLLFILLLHNFKLINLKSMFVWWPGSFWQILWARFRKSKIGLIALCVFALLLLAAVFAPIIAPYEFTKQNLLNVHSSPSLEHLFGTDGLGRDLFSRALFGVRTSFIVAPVVAGITLFLGTSFGLMAGYFRGRVDAAIMRFCEFLAGFPGLLFAILISATIKPRILDFLRPYEGMINLGIVDFLVLFLALSFIGWSGLAIFVRGEVLRLQSNDFMEAARALGASPVRLMQRHLLPNLTAIIILILSTSFPAVIMEEAILSFIGIGISDPNTSLGQLVNSEYGYWRTSNYHVVFIPAIILAVLMYASVFLGEILNDVLNPKSRMK